jgi:DNA-binding NtrC family response regulator
LRGEELALVGDSPPMRALRTEIATAARTNAKVLILGETGVGKEVVARLIHTQGSRRARPFVPVNCSGIPETLLESELFGHMRGSFTGAYRDKVGLVRQADGGTLFLDELGEMSLRMQAMLLRFAESGEIQPVGSDTPIGRMDVRLVTATHRDLQAQVAAETFRLDLYYRLNVVEIQIPPLRDRGTDINLLLRHFIRDASDAHRIPCPTLTNAAEALLARYAWPGNVRQLKNVTERLVVRHAGHAITPDELPSEIRDYAAAAAAPVLSAPPVSATSSITARISGEPATDTRSALWTRLMAGENFWAVVCEPFKARDLTRDDVRAIVHRGLLETLGSYRGLLRLFHLPESDYKRFLAFLSTHDCHLPFHVYRGTPIDQVGEPDATRRFRVAPRPSQAEMGSGVLV